MNNLHRELAPISEVAWRDLESQVRDTFMLHAGARRVVDMPDPHGPTLAAVGTGHRGTAAMVVDDVELRVPTAQPAVELRRHFQVSRAAVDSVEHGAQDADWALAIQAAQQLATAEDTIILNGTASPGTVGLRSGSSNNAVVLPTDMTTLPTTVAQARAMLRSASVGGPYTLLLNPDLYTAVSAATTGGYPTFTHVAELLGGDIVACAGLTGGQLVSTRGGDYELVLGRDLAIGYHTHDAETIGLYLQESFAFLSYTAEASVTLTATDGRT